MDKEFDGEFDETFGDLEDSFRNDETLPVLDPIMFLDPNLLTALVAVSEADIISRGEARNIIGRWFDEVEVDAA